MLSSTLNIILNTNMRFLFENKEKRLLQLCCICILAVVIVINVYRNLAEFNL